MKGYRQRDPRHDADGPRRVLRDWLSFNEHRPIRPGLGWRFLAAIAALLGTCGLLAILSAIAR